MTPIQPPAPPVLDPNAAVAAMGAKHCNGKVIGYRTRSSDPMVALLTCLSAGGKRDSASVKPPNMLWGFVYLNEPGHEPRFVRNSAIESIEMAMGLGTPVALWDSISELINPVSNSVFARKVVKPDEDEEDDTPRPLREIEECDLVSDLFPELQPIADRLLAIHYEMQKKGYVEYALGPYRTR